MCNKKQIEVTTERSILLQKETNCSSRIIIVFLTFVSSAEDMCRVGLGQG